MFLFVSNVLFPLVQCYKAPPLNQCSRGKVQHVNVHLLFNEIAKSQQCSISCEFNFAFIKLTGIFDSLYKPCSSACIGGTFADRGNSMLSHVFVFSDSWIKVTVHFFSCPFDICSSLFFLSRPQNENATEGSGHRNIPTMCDGCDLDSVLLFTFSLQVYTMWHKQQLLPFCSCTQSVTFAGGLS